ncbi:TetR/AcrR family transcriptional regulator [Marinicauda algicola]|uniref:TetR/AcrR family transcriptional regulator n=1 Tax=Marinicauda algicola TaxID=2029849 RepID=A0A4S2GY78_9PROT|nr:TetR/AcrR family transcriptional regulator [Marinicauda algicola]TGY88137.1 TetR/AcrR family transcriptional regulator [Marinicauda algicola]
MSKPVRQRRPEDRPDEILDAALAEFTEAGFAGAKVEDIARRAGVSKGTIYLYFDTKEAMLKALVEQSAGRIAQGAAALIEAGAARDPVQTYRSVFRMVLTAMSDPDISAAPRLVLSEAARFPELARYYRERVIQIGIGALKRLLETGAQSGVFRKVDLVAAERVLAGPAVAHLMLSTVFALPGDPRPDPARLADQITDIVLYGLTPRTDRP